MRAEFGCVARAERACIEAQARQYAVFNASRRRGVLCKAEQLRRYTAAQHDWCLANAGARKIDAALLQYVRDGGWRHPSRLIVEWCLHMGATGTAAFVDAVLHRHFWTATWLLAKGALPDVVPMDMVRTWTMVMAHTWRWSRHEKQAFSALCKRLPTHLRASWQLGAF